MKNKKNYREIGVFGIYQIEIPNKTVSVCKKYIKTFPEVESHNLNRIYLILI